MFAFFHRERKRAVCVFRHSAVCKGEIGGRNFSRHDGNGFFCRFPRILEFKMYRAFRSRIKELFGGQKVQIFVFSRFFAVYKKTRFCRGRFQPVVRDNSEHVFIADLQNVGVFCRPHFSYRCRNRRYGVGIDSHAIQLFVKKDNGRVFA